jgi:hypothetical protein
VLVESVVDVWKEAAGRKWGGIFRGREVLVESVVGCLERKCW